MRAEVRIHSASTDAKRRGAIDSAPFSLNVVFPIHGLFLTGNYAAIPFRILCRYRAPRRKRSRTTRLATVCRQHSKR
jgi:hypothetical protein